jgi:hypothetical protein
VQYVAPAQREERVRRGGEVEDIEKKHALQRKTHLYIPRKGIARPQFKFPHSCVC